MATVREGHVPVLLVVDAQVAVMKEAWRADRVVESIARAVARAREEGVAVVWVQHTSDDLPRGSPQWQWAPELVPRPDETLIHKHYNSSFEETQLDQQLAKLGATHIALAGAATNWCIRATAYGALERGYDLTLIEDAHSTGSIPLNNGSKIEAADVIKELNVAMTWVSYPGRKNGTATADAIDFSQPPGTANTDRA